MRTQQLYVDGRPTARAEVAATFPARFRGLMLRRRLPEALLLVPERSVHGLWMRVPIDVAVLDARGLVLRTLVLRPWTVSGSSPGGHAVLEAPTGSFERWGLGPGSAVAVEGWPVAGAPTRRA